jgi:hypothetical protein
MDLIRQAQAKRLAMNIPPETMSSGKGSKNTQSTPPKGTKAFRNFIIAEKPSKKVVMEHFEALIETECDVSSVDE